MKNCMGNILIAHVVRILEKCQIFKKEVVNFGEARYLISEKQSQEIPYFVERTASSSQ